MPSQPFPRNAWPHSGKCEGGGPSVSPGSNGTSAPLDCNLPSSCDVLDQQALVTIAGAVKRVMVHPRHSIDGEVPRTPLHAFGPQLSTRERIDDELRHIHRHSKKLGDVAHLEALLRCRHELHSLASKLCKLTLHVVFGLNRKFLGQEPFSPRLELAVRSVLNTIDTPKVGRDLADRCLRGIDGYVCLLIGGS